MLITQSENFQKFEFESLAGIVSSTWQTKIEEIVVTVKITAPVRLLPVAMLVDDAAVEPSPLCPDPSREKGREEEERAQDPPLCLSSSCTTPTAMTAPEPTHSTPQPRPNPPSTRARPPCPVLLDARCQGPCTGELLDALALVSPAYKSPRRSNEPTRPAPSYLPDTLTSPRSLSFVVAIPAGEVLDAEGAAAFDLLGASRRRELVEEPRRSLFRPSPSSSASSTLAAVAVVFFSVRR
jgi:hypothetical protein